MVASLLATASHQRGAFDSTAAYMTVGALVFYPIGLVNSAVKSYIY